MITRIVPRCIAIVSLFLTSVATALAGSYTFSTPQNINFDTLGGSVYSLTADASVAVGDSYEAWSQLSVGSISLSDYSIGYGESDCYISISGIRKISGQWVADSVYTFEQNLNGSPITNVYYNVPMSAITYVTGYTLCNGYSNPFWCQVLW
jgi:hypothetical protein